MKNWNRGLLRLFIVFSVVVLFYGLITENSRNGEIKIDAAISLDKGIEELNSGQCDLLRNVKTRRRLDLDDREISHCVNLNAFLSYIEWDVGGVDLTDQILRIKFDQKFDHFMLRNSWQAALFYFVSIWLLYGLLLLIIKVFAWVVRGFATERD